LELNWPCPTPAVRDSVTFRTGLKAPFRGLSFLLHNPRLWPFAILPVTIATSILVGGSCASIALLPRAIASLIGHGHAWYEVAGVTALEIIAATSGVVVSLVLALALAQPLSGPALNRLVRAMEKQLGVADHPLVPWWREMGRSALAALIGMAWRYPIWPCSLSSTSRCRLGGL